MNRKGQIWVETALYALIILALIGLVLAFVSPRIEEEKDRILVEQTIESLNVFDDKINAVLEKGEGNRRVVEFGMRRGELYFNSSSEEIVFSIKDLKKPYSEPDIGIDFGRIKVISVEGKKTSSIHLSLDYKTLANLTFGGKEEDKKFNPTITPYKFSIENLGNHGSLFEIVNIDLVS